MIQRKWHRGFSPGAILLVVALTGILLCGLMPERVEAQGGGGFRLFLTPNRVEARLHPGERKLLSFRLGNNDKENPLRLKVFLSDVRQGVRGQYLLSDTTMPYSCVSWLEVPDTLIEIPPGEMHEALIPIRVPIRARGGAYGAVVFRILPVEAQADNRGRPLAATTYEYQVPGFIEVTVDRSGSELKRLKSGKIDIHTPENDEALAKQYGPDMIMVAAEITNTGNILVITDGQLIFRDENNQLVRRVPLGAGRGAILPEATTFLRSIIRRPNPGKYSIKAIVQYGGHSPAVSMTTFEFGRRAVSQVDSLDTSIPLEIEIRPMEFALKAPANSFRTQGATIINRESFPVALEVSMGQIYHDLMGQLWTTDETDSGRTVAGWVEFDPAEMVIEPGRRKTVRLTINVADTAAGGYYGCLMFNARVADTTGVSEKFLPSELSMPIVVEVPPNLEYAGEILDIKVDETAFQGVTLRPVYRNLGNTHAIVSGKAVIEMWSHDIPNVDSSIVLSVPKYEQVGEVTIELDSTLIFPGEARMLSTQTMEQLPPGRYRATVEINCGPVRAAPTTTLEKEFVIKESEDSM